MSDNRPLDDGFKWSVFFNHPCGCRTYWLFLSELPAPNEPGKEVESELVKIELCSLHKDDEKAKMVGHKETIFVGLEGEEHETP